MSRDTATLQSIVIVRMREGYEAVARFSNPLDDFILSHEYKGALYSMISRAMYAPERRRRHARR